MKKLFHILCLCFIASTLSAQRIAIMDFQASSSSGNASSSTPTEYSTTSQPTSPSNSQPIVLYGYLKVFPHDLGTFDARPFSIIENINRVGQYGYKAWRIPTKEELSLLYSNNLIDDEPRAYISQDGSSCGRLRLVCDKQPGEVIREVPDGYIDLGLPSGTLWCMENQFGFYSYSTAVSQFGNTLPTRDQFHELLNECTWIWQEDGYKVVGPNGQYMYLPAAGWKRDSTGELVDLDEEGFYWTRTSDASDSDRMKLFYFDSTSTHLGSVPKKYLISVRLVQ